MTSKDKSAGSQSHGPAHPPDPREARLAKALRENLRRRKAKADEEPKPADPEKAS
jgi:hypothetical protein